jgi:hypothetical protein
MVKEKNMVDIKQTSEPGGVNHSKKRIFTITLAPQDTKSILESPHFFITPSKLKSGLRFQITDRGDAIYKEDLAFRLDPEGMFYVMAMPTGFKDDQKHLDYLIKLGDVPMLIPFQDREIPCGYVRFKAASPA